MSRVRFAAVPSIGKCGLCGAEMVRRTRQRDGHTFYGCSAFPECMHTIDDPDAPDDGEQDARMAARRLGLAGGGLLDAADDERDWDVGLTCDYGGIPGDR